MQMYIIQQQTKLPNSEQSYKGKVQYPIDISAILWGKDWKWKNILFWCDNEATVGIVKKRPI
jgi:hypothetical protein